MAVTRIGRRKLLKGSLLAASALAIGAPRLVFGQAGPAAVQPEAARPKMAQGVMAGDVSGDRAMIWSRADRPARMIVEYSTTESFAERMRAPAALALPENDFTSRVELSGLAPGQDVFFRVAYLDLADLKTLSAPAAGRFRTAPAQKRPIKIAWSGDTAGQGWGINPEWGGMRMYETMRRVQPDLFIHSGDTIYADNALKPEVPLPNGQLWRNIVTEEKSKVAETLKEFRGNYLYNLLDGNVRRFNAEIAQIWQWDDHEVTNNWSPSKDLSADARYAEKRVGLLIARATKAFLEYAPLRPSSSEAERVYRHIAYGPSLDIFVVDMRSYRGPNSHNRQNAESDETAFLGAAQTQWLIAGLKASQATWKLVAADMPLGLLVGDGKDAAGRDRFENAANGDGPALGRELEIARLLKAIKGIKNIVWITADTHYTAAHFFDPAKAQFTDFDPFWEFMSGPIHAGSFGPGKTDNTFGIQVMWQKSPEGRPNLPPSEGLQFFGEIAIDGRSEAMTVAIKDLAGVTLYTNVLEPQRS